MNNKASFWKVALTPYLMLGVFLCCAAFLGCPQAAEMVDDVMQPSVDGAEEEPSEDGPSVAFVPEGMVLIPAGEFQMGSDDADADKNEQPVHTVYVDAFYMDKYEVTNAEYAEFLNAKGKHAEGDLVWLDTEDGGEKIEFVAGVYRAKAGHADHPVVKVSWYGAMAYAAWAGKRLPTEAEWEKAARGGLSGQKYPWGNTIDSSKANYNALLGGTTAAGEYPANGYGLYDMSGNVWEWCLDEYNNGFYSVSPTRNPVSVRTASVGY